MIYSWSKNQISQVIKFIDQNYAHIKVFLLYGNVGVGKTTFIQKMYKNLNVFSPSFTGYNIYNDENHNILHIDEYFKSVLFTEMLIEYETQNYTIFIEWPRNLYMFTFFVVIYITDTHIYIIENFWILLLQLCITIQKYESVFLKSF